MLIVSKHRNPGQIHDLLSLYCRYCHNFHYYHYYVGGTRNRPVDRKLLSPLYIRLANLAQVRIDPRLEEETELKNRQNDIEVLITGYNRAR